jgi:hypothetical protein
MGGQHSRKIAPTSGSMRNTTTAAIRWRPSWRKGVRKSASIRSETMALSWKSR